MKRASILKHLLALISLTAVVVPHHASGAEIIWGNIFEDTLLNSSASVDNPNPLSSQQLDTTFSFEIGTFGGFIPTYANIDQWAANWKLFDGAYVSNGGWDAPNQNFAGADHLDTNGNSTSPFADPSDVFAQGERIYLWVYNSKDIVPTSEWALVTDATVLGNVGAPWVMPDPADTGGFYELFLSEADEAIIGGVNGVRGPGDYTYANPPNVSNPNTTNGFTIQTAVVPEPGSVLLLFTAAAAFLTRRTTRRLARSTIA
ncbi:MAG TPA: PEP-CTERM sorting domain-containing protein [Prosthecobacter sp.]